ncbi:LysR family transcriptional regulator [Aureimonas populi]|uniref:LysR family transcriptional regulator n=1 Tax=Aureimonas populi TaxID=1701758 RepID=A0ABW5CIR2_9HYPH|nr:LysR family transcriptional regulator [Aureimonas populi]
MNRPTFSDLTALLAVASHRSFRQAADELGVAASTLSHAVRGLEEELGVRLLHRTTRSVSPTEAGAELVSRLGPALEGVDAALQAVAAFRGSVAGTVRINAHRSAARLLVAEVVPQVIARHPQIVVDIVTEGRLVDIVEGGFDAGVRLAEAVPRDMIAVPLGGSRRFVCVAAPAYLDSAGAPRVPEDLKDHRCIRHRMPGGKIYRWEFERHGSEAAVDVNGSIVLDDHDLMLEAALAGLGIAYVVDLVAEPHIAAGRLRTVLDEWCVPIDGLKLYYPGHRRVPPALRAFLDVVREMPRVDR